MRRAAIRQFVKRKTASRRPLQNQDQVFGSGGYNGVLPLPAPAKQTQRAEAGGEERESGGQGGSEEINFVNSPADYEIGRI